MPTAAEVKQDKKGTAEFGNKEALIEHAKTVSHGHARAEAVQLDEQIKARQALLESIPPDQRSRLAEQLKSHARVTSGVANVGAKDVQLPPATCISYQVQRAPFTSWWSQEPRQVTSSCVSILSGQNVGLTAVSEQDLASEGALSVQAAIGDFFIARCQPTGPWFIGEGNTAVSAIGQIADTGLVLPSTGLNSL